MWKNETNPENNLHDSRPQAVELPVWSLHCKEMYLELQNGVAVKKTT